MRALTNSGTGSWYTTEVSSVVRSKQPSIMKRTLKSLAVGAACLAATAAQAQISVGVGGAGPLSFDTTPAAAEFSTFVLNGTATTFADAPTLDTAVAALTVGGIEAISRQLPTSTTVPPSAFSGGFRHNNGTGLFIQSRPTTDGTNAAGAMLATLQNDSGSARSTLTIAYDFNSFNAIAGELPGFNVYYSMTGEAGSWQIIPELTGIETVGNHFAQLNLGSWAVGSRMYLLWADDNANGNTDPSYTIDNLRVAFAGESPTIVAEPSSVTNIVGRTVRLTVAAGGPGLQYQWQKVGFGPIDTLANPSAATATLVITNAQLADTGEYFVSVNNPFGGVSSANAFIQIDPDTFPPQFLAARLGANPNEIILVVDEPLWLDGASGCLTSATEPFNWDIFNPNNASDVPGASSITIVNDTNLVFTTSLPWTAGEKYTILMNGGSGGVTDLSCIAIPTGTSIDTLPTVSFQQGLNGYAGTSDAGIHSGTGIDAADGANPIINVDGDDGGVRQALLRFDDLFGPNAGQIPSGAVIRQAILTINQTDNGNVVNLHRMLGGWDQNTVTWNLLNGGLTADDVEVATAFDASTPGLNGVVGPITIDVTASVQAWAAGQPNYGWAFLPTGGDGWRWNSSESTATPLLSVQFEVTPCVEAPAIVTQPPTAVSANEGSPISITVGVTACLPTFQWTKDGVDIAGATSSTLTIASAVPGAGGSAGVYRLRISNPNGTVTSGPATVSVAGDTTRPVLTRAIGPNNTTVVLTFSKALGAGAGDTSHYTVSGAGVTVSAAVVANNVVTLTTSARAAGSSTVTITGVTDNRVGANLINPNPTTVALTTVQVLEAYAGTWSYNTNNLDANADWTTTGGAGWLDGAGLFGTETTAATVALFPTPIATVIPPANANNEFLTSYYRKTVNLPALAAGMSYALAYIVDDGAVFFLDGVEISRYNMPAGAVAYATLAPAAGPEGVQLALSLPATAGSHTIAVSVHQNANTSSDTVFGAQIIAIPTVSPALAVTHSGTNTVVTWNADASWELVSSANVNGPWAAVAGAPFRSFTTPSTQAAQFYQLRYRP